MVFQKCKAHCKAAQQNIEELQSVSQESLIIDQVKDIPKQ